jgi:hypothetical protein
MKMIKSFCKQNKRKLILTIVFSVYGFFSLTFYNENFWQETIISKFLLAVVYIGHQLFSLIPYYITTIILEDSLYPYIGTGMMFIFFVLLFVYNYVISCLVLWIYDKIRKR